MQNFDIKQIKRLLNANLLLDMLQASHGLNPNNYQTWQTDTGEYRIKAGNRNLNVSDFCTKEMHMSWNEAEKYLSACYAKQLEISQHTDLEKTETQEHNNLVHEKMIERKARTVTRTFLQKHIVPYIQAVDIVKIKYKEDGTTLGRQNIATNVEGEKIYEILLQKNAYYQNKKYNENIYIRDVGEKTKLLWLDDVKPENIDTTMTLIETSPGNYQAFFKLDSWVTREQAKIMRAYLQTVYQTDANAISIGQPMRLPGYMNMKPKYIENGNGFMINVRYESDTVYSVEDLLITAELELDDVYIKKTKLTLDAQAVEQARGQKWPSLKYIRKYDSHGHTSQSVIDFHYAVYLVNNYYTDVQIAAALKDMTNTKRKGAYEDDYIARTIAAARNPFYNKHAISNEQAEKAQERKRRVQRNTNNAYDLSR